MGNLNELKSIDNSKIFIVTGASRGIGFGLCEALLKENDKGANNFIFGCSRSEIRINNESFQHLSVDVSNVSKVKKVFQEIKDHLNLNSKIILINNAGMASMNHFLLGTEKKNREIIDVNFFGTLNCSREATKLMQKNQWGRIINLSSIAVPLCLEGEAVYAAAKSSVEKLTAILAKEVANFNITVNCLGPSLIKTDLTKLLSEDKVNSLLNKQCFHKFCEISDIKNVIDFFVKDESNFLTGQTLYLGGSY